LKNEQLEFPNDPTQTHKLLKAEVLEFPEAYLRYPVLILGDLLYLDLMNHFLEGFHLVLVAGYQRSEIK
jgi:hypothetical protein